MSDDTDFIESVLKSREGRTDVTEEYEELVQMAIELAESRSVPIPFSNVLVYQDPDDHPELVVFLFTVDMNTDIMDSTYGFEVAVKEHVAEHIDSDTDGTEQREFDMFIDQFNRQLRLVQETIWDDVVNINGDMDDGTEQ